jgi:hypothetical protein
MTRRDRDEEFAEFRRQQNAKAEENNAKWQARKAAEATRVKAVQARLLEALDRRRR